ncbi:MAG: hypothetical protein ACK4IX_06105, partial [Candidatus Sericytochromatia bacterium]
MSIFKKIIVLILTVILISSCCTNKGFTIKFAPTPTLPSDPTSYELNISSSFINIPSETLQINLRAVEKIKIDGFLHKNTNILDFNSTYTIIWDGKDDNGKYLPSGTYTIRALDKFDNQIVWSPSPPLPPGWSLLYPPGTYPPGYVPPKPLISTITIINNEKKETSCDESTPPLLPSDINNLLQMLGQYLLPNALNPVIDKVDNLTNNLDRVNKLSGQYGFSTQATKEEKAKVKYDALVDQITQSKQSLLTESNNLKNIANNILNEVKTTSNVNKQVLSKEVDFNGYKLKVEELVDEVNYLITDENTFSLAEASAVYGQEVGLLANIIEDYANRVLPVKISNEEELEQYQDDENG